MTSERDVVVLGAGLCGLAAAASLGERAVVVERNRRPGGLVRTEQIGDYWFDHVIHLLHFADPVTQQRIVDLDGTHLEACPPEAFVEAGGGISRFPIQLHLGDLPEDVARRCVDDFAQAARRDDARVPGSYEEMLLRTFGRALCETFFFPYNRKMWKRPLESLAPTGFHWNIARPSLEEVLRGLRARDARAGAYNDNGWYPRPPAGAPLRGMEILPQRLAAKACDVRLGHEVVEIDPGLRTIRARAAGREHAIRWREACLSTIPLPAAIRFCVGAPEELVQACTRLRWNRVRSVALCLRGRRPRGTGHWRYFADEALCFTRLVFITEFDPLCAPPDGIALLAEITERAEDAPARADDLIARAWRDVRSTGILEPSASLLDARVLDADPAYVVFTPDAERVIARGRAFLSDQGITALGRYGRWEYSSMAQVLRDGFAFADALQGASVAA